MALLGNYNQFTKNPIQNTGGDSLSGIVGLRYNWNQSGISNNRFYGENWIVGVADKCGVPNGYSAPYSWKLSMKTGGLGSNVGAMGSGSFSGSGALGMNIESTIEGLGQISNANLGLILSAVATLSGLGGLSADIVGALNAAATLAGNGDMSGSLGALAGAVATLSGTGSMSNNITAKAFLSADIYVNQSEASVQQIVDGVWNALAANYNTSGTMGEAVQTGGSGGGYTPAQIADAVWDEPLTGATHNVPTSAGRRVRQLGQIVIYDGIAQGSGIGNNQIQLDIGASSINGAYDPSEIAIVLGTGAGQSRMIIDYVGSTRTATVDRNWKVNPDATSEFILYVNSGREHVNEGLAQGGTTNTITLNSSASSFNDSYNGQTIFLRSGNGEDQVARVTEYNGTTKVATISTSMAGNGWSIIPDTTTGYVMLPNYHIESGGGGGGLTEAEHKHLMKLRNGGGGALINYESIEKGLAKDREWLYKKIEEIPTLITTSEGNIVNAIGLVNNSVSTIIGNRDIENLAGFLETLSEKTEEATRIANETAKEGKHKMEKVLHTIETNRLEDEIKEETKELEEKHETIVQKEIKELETEIQIQDEAKSLSLEIQIQEEINYLSNL